MKDTIKTIIEDCEKTLEEIDKLPNNNYFKFVLDAIENKGINSDCDKSIIGYLYFCLFQDYKRTQKTD